MNEQWSDDPVLAARVRGTYRNIKPNAWDIHVWNDGHAIPGTLDVADAHRLIAEIIRADVDDDGLG